MMDGLKQMQRAYQELSDQMEVLIDALERISQDPRAGYSVRGIAKDALNAIKTEPLVDDDLDGENPLSDVPWHVDPPL